MEHQVQVIILNWNNYSDTCEAIESAASAAGVAGVLLVDNASTDGSFDRLRETFAGNPKIAWIRNPRNLGFAGGMNVGIQKVSKMSKNRPRYVLLMNNDAVLDAQCVQRLVERCEEDPQVGMAGPRIFYYNDPGRICQGGGRFSRWRMGVISPEKNKMPLNDGPEAQEVTFLTGCVLLIRQELFLKLGLLNEKCFLYAEDIDYALRAVRHGYKLIYVPQARAWHKIGNIARDRTSATVMYHMARSHVIVFKENFSRWRYRYALMTQLLLYTPFRMWQIIRGSRSPNAAASWFKGFWDGMRTPVDPGARQPPSQ